MVLTTRRNVADWISFYEEGKSLHRTAQGSVRRPEVFTPTIILNIAAMSIEKYFMAIFRHRNTLPRNHAMRDLLDEARPFIPISGDLEATLLYMDSLQSICGLDTYRVEAPRAEDVPRFIEAIDEVALLSRAELGEGALSEATSPSP